MTEAQKGDARNYQKGQVVQFHQNASGIGRGEQLTVAGPDGDGGVVLENSSGEKVALPLDKTNRFNVYEATTLPLAAGERIRITKGGQTKDGHRLDNGSFYQVQGFTRDGDIELRNGWLLDKGYGNIDYGYVATSYAAQGQTVDRVFIAQSAESFPATSAEQFYVSLSRGKASCKVYTDDKEMLLTKAIQSGQRMSATEMLRQAAEDAQKKHGEMMKRIGYLGKEFDQARGEETALAVADPAETYLQREWEKAGSDQGAEKDQIREEEREEEKRDIGPELGC